MRPAAAAAGFIASYLGAWLGLLLLLPAAGIRGTLLPLLMALATAFWIWRALGQREAGIAATIVTGAAIGAAIGFVLGFFGPMLIAPAANQGPLLGLFITGPAGALIGLVTVLVHARR
jgi:hypothetical protein